MDIKQSISDGKTFLGIELGSTRVKSILIDENFSPVASGSHDWENLLEDGIWTYRLDDVWTAVQSSFRSLSLNVKEKYGINLAAVGAIGISAMMHGYLAFDGNGNQLAQFRTWRNTTTEKAAAALTENFQFNIPLRWSVAHLYQAILDGESHVKDIDFITTLAGFVHWKLTGKKVLGIGDASGMFPVDGKILNYDSTMLERFSALASPFGFNWKIENILPSVLNAGENAGSLTDEGAKFLAPDGSLKAGILFCPPEGDAGTGMVATNSVTERTGNISAGTSIFAMIVLEKELSKVYPEIDIVATPAGRSAAMVHCNNCTSDIDAWVKLFGEVAAVSGAKISKASLYDALYEKALAADTDCGGLVAYNYFSGEPLAGIDEGRPLFARLADSKFTLANFMRTILFSAFGALKYGMDILTIKENVRVDSLLGHGGLFKTKIVGQRLMAAALNTPVSVMEASAGEGGAWGIALLAAFMFLKNNEKSQTSLDEFLAEKVFAGLASVKICPNDNDSESFRIFMERYTAGLKIEKAAAENLKN
ncbi:MAG: FGGY-family carbohydrate kinase [Treponema sp.]|nr:FGGY-family carbohydrate kinase [Treponema sp.]MCL2271777.1 FGGY-family carbohydrate kinase [Treponema sp.]